MKLILLFFNWIASPSARNDYLIYSEVDKNTLKEIENLVDEILKIKNKNFVGILNSKLVKYFICKYSDKTGAGDIMLNVQSLEKIPIVVMYITQ